MYQRPSLVRYAPPSTPLARTGAGITEGLVTHPGVSLAAGVTALAGAGYAGYLAYKAPKTEEKVLWGIGSVACLGVSTPFLLAALVGDAFGK